jgi:hypothetical protein
MARPPRVPVDLQAKTKFVKERVERAILELEQIAQTTDPIFANPKDVQLALWLAERESCESWFAAPPPTKRRPLARHLPGLLQERVTKSV